MATTQYLACKFREADTRSYTYSYDGDEALTIGDQVMVPDSRSDGWKRVIVVSISDIEPPFACKAVLGKAPPEPEPETVEDVAEGGQ